MYSAQCSRYAVGPAFSPVPLIRGKAPDGIRITMFGSPHAGRRRTSVSLRVGRAQRARVKQAMRIQPTAAAVATTRGAARNTEINENHAAPASTTARDDGSTNKTGNAGAPSSPLPMFPVWKCHQRRNPVTRVIRAGRGRRSMTSRVSLCLTSPAAVNITAT